MAKKKLVKKDPTVKTAAPQFKPGDKPYLEYDGVMLNANIPWKEVIADIIAKGVNVKAIAAEAEMDERIIHNILQNNNTDGLTFRAGARIITMHYHHQPEYYPE